MNQKNNSNMMVIGGVILVLVIGLGAFLMMRNNTAKETQVEVNIEPTAVMEDTTANDEAMPTETTTEVTKAMEDTKMEDDSDVKTIEVEMGAFYYKPNVITVKKGQKVKLVLKSVDMMHDFNIDELKVKSEIVKSGNTGEVEFTADKVGTYEYYCSVGEHRVKGQIGKLIVQ